MVGKAGVQKRWTENLRKIKTLTFLGGGGGGGEVAALSLPVFLDLCHGRRN